MAALGSPVLRAQAPVPEQRPEIRAPQVERLKDDNDARLPPDAPSPQMLAAALASGDYRVDALVSGFKLPSSTVTYSFYEDSVFGGAYYGGEAGVREVSEPVKANVRAIMAWYGTLMNVTFVEVAETSSTIGYIRFMLSNNPAYAYAYYPSGSAMFSVAGDVHLNPTYDRLGDTNGFQHPAGEHGYVSLIHEIGHTLGLKHPHDSTPTLPSAEDNHSHTVMSYNFPGESPGTPMAYDLLALQYLYGVRAQRTGNDTYLFTRAALDQYSLGGQLFINPSTPTKQTLWDMGGTNVIDLSGLAPSASGYRLDLGPLGWLTTGSAYQGSYFVAGLSLGPGVSVQKLVNSVSNDTIYAGPEANVFAGYAAARATGNDVIYGADAADVIDLSGYRADQVTQTPSGTDLRLQLGTNGSVTVKGYFSGNPPAIVFETGVPNQPPVAVTGAAPASGPAPLAVTFAGSGSYDPDGRIVSYAWAFGDGGTSTEANPAHTYAASGTYTARLTVTDDRGATNTASATVSALPPAQPVMSVSSLVMTAITRSGKPAAQAAVRIVDGSGQLVSDATVKGVWSGLVTGSVSKATNTNGRVVFKSKATTGHGMITFTVTGVTKAGLTYDAARNVATTGSVVIP